MKTKGFQRALALLTAMVLMLCSLTVPAFASQEISNSAVTADRDGILQVKVVYTDDDKVDHDVLSGTGFLINETTILTCNHNVTADQDTIEGIRKKFAPDKSDKKILDKLKIEVNVNRDVTVNAKVYKSSAEVDYAILSLTDGALVGKKSIPLRKAENGAVQQTEKCFALGFPGVVTDVQNAPTYTSGDVTITNGEVNKVGSYSPNGKAVNYIVCNAKFSQGNSGGPLVDIYGNAIGICQFILAEEKNEEFDPEKYSYAVTIDQVIETLDTLGVPYTTGDLSGNSDDLEGDKNQPDDKAAAEETPTPTPVPVDKSGLEAAIKTAEPYNDSSKYVLSEEFNNVWSEANSVINNSEATQAEVDNTAKALTAATTKLQPKKSLFANPLIIAAIVAAVLLLIILIVLFTRKKPTQPTYPQTPPIPTPPVPPVTPPGGNVGQAPNGQFAGYKGGANGTTVLGSAGETTVLNQGSNETTVLGNSQNFGTLTRRKNHETIQINKSSFRIGRERSKVDYCISDNTAIGRLHAIIISRNGEAYLVDQDSVNGTSVNDVKASPRQETKLRSGDKITLADEDFTFNF